MKVRERKPILEATQWFPGKDVEGVTGTAPNYMCGCVMVYGEASRQPHVHIKGWPPVLINPGDWVLKDSAGRFRVCKSGDFGHIYEKVHEK